MRTDVNLIWNGEKAKIQGHKVTGKTAWELGLIVEGQAKLLCPIDYGYLAASITVASISQSTELDTPKPDNSRPKSFPHNVSTFKKITASTDPNEILVGTAVDYAAHVEFGTMKSDAQPFLRPALDLAKGKILALLTYNGKTYLGDYLQ